MDIEGMKRGVGIFLVLIVALVGFAFLSNYTGAAAYGYSGSGYPSGRFAPPNDLGQFGECVSMSLERYEYIDKEGVPVFRPGNVMKLTVFPGKKPFFTGGSIVNFETGLRVFGGSGHNAQNLDVCGSNFAFAIPREGDDEASYRREGSYKCSRAREGLVRTPFGLNTEKTYVFRMKDTNKKCGDKNGYVLDAPFRVMDPFSGVRDEVFTRGQTGPDL